MKTIGRRLAAMEDEAMKARADYLSPQLKSAIIVDQMEAWFRGGATPKEIGEHLAGLGYDAEDAGLFASDLAYDHNAEIIRIATHSANGGDQQR